MFEAPVAVLQRDPKSLLAQLCGPDPPVLPDPDGFFYFDRDWCVVIFLSVDSSVEFFDIITLFRPQVVISLYYDVYAGWSAAR